MLFSSPYIAVVNCALRYTNPPIPPDMTHVALGVVHIDVIAGIWINLMAPVMS